MRKIVLAFLVLMMAGLAQGTTIYDIQSGFVEEGSLVTPGSAVVTAVTYNGIWVAEAPYAAMNGIWVYMGSELPIDFVPGDVVTICGEYKEYYDLTEIDIVAPGPYGSVVKTGTTDVPPSSQVTAAELAADPEPWESCVITIVDGMMVSELPDQYGQWYAEATDGTPVMFDDVFYDDTTVVLGECYNNATGVYNYGYGDFKLLAFVDGVELVGCEVETDQVTFDQIKSLYR